MRQLISFLAYIHTNKIINRDIRPENILLEDFVYKTINEEEHIFFTINVCDFKSSTSFSLDKLTKKIGNSYYIAPEVLKRKYDEKVDVWSCGIIMYMLLSGKAPFKGDTEKEILHEIGQGKFEYFGIFI